MDFKNSPLKKMTKKCNLTDAIPSEIQPR